MKSFIFNNYNILINDINNNFFYYNNDLYFLNEVLNDDKVLEETYGFVLENNIESFEIIKNKENKLISYYEGKKYSLLKIKGVLKYEYKFDEFKFYPIKKDGYNWGQLWSDRLDYYEIQLRELGINYQTVLNTYGMFSGLAENAILYFNLSKESFKDEIVVSIQHNRMKYPCYLIDYNNPLYFVIDYNVRDVAEYIKAYLISDDYELENILLLLDGLNLNNLMFNLLYSRLLYPTFYFDIYDKIILDDGVDSDIEFVIDVVPKYLELLNKIYLKYKIKYNMFNVQWINKKM